jgi:hypothetical protein
MPTDAPSAKRIARFIEPFRVTPGSHVTLAEDFDPAFKAGVEKKKDGAELLTAGIEMLAEYQAPSVSSSSFRRWMRPARTGRSAM